MKPEDKARRQIDVLLEGAGWKIQDIDQLNLGASKGVAVREVPLKSGPADYLLVINRKAFGVVEAKPYGTTLSGVAEQSQEYLSGIPPNIPSIQMPLPFAYESTGIETFFRDLRDPDPRSRHVFSFHTPETMEKWMSESDTLRSRLQNIEKSSPLTETRLRNCQIEEIKNLEKSFARMRQRSLIQMATGSGKTYTANID